VAEVPPPAFEGHDGRFNREHGIRLSIDQGEASVAGRIAFNLRELSGAFGDIGTDLPLLLGLVAINGLDASSVFVLFGVFQILNGVRYGLPMPVQPLKAMAAIMIATRPDPSLLFGAGLSIGAIMIVLSFTGALTKLHERMPRSVVRGIQLGLGMSLMAIAAGYMQRDGLAGWVLAGAGLVFVLALRRRSSFPTSLVLIAAGGAYALVGGLNLGLIADGVGLHLPRFQLPTIEGILQGTLLLSLQQLPLSIANSVIATSLLVADLFPARKDVTIRSIGTTYGLMNLVAPFFGGVPVCHGCGGLAGHVRFGARTGGSVIIYGTMFLVVGLFFSSVVEELLVVFPFPVLGVILALEGLALVFLVEKAAPEPNGLMVALLVGALVIAVPYGYLVGMVAGILLHHVLSRSRVDLGRIHAIRWVEGLVGGGSRRGAAVLGLGGLHGPGPHGVTGGRWRPEIRPSAAGARASAEAPDEEPG